ncbi:MAG: hypothetical protein CMM25_02810 [Rhodospirillaceae bacterium]|nr:hypothetical protein [Rhodospirillaceae bacterium]
MTKLKEIEATRKRQKQKRQRPLSNVPVPPDVKQKLNELQYHRGTMLPSESPKWDSPQMGSHNSDNNAPWENVTTINNPQRTNWIRKYGGAATRVAAGYRGMKGRDRGRVARLATQRQKAFKNSKVRKMIEQTSHVPLSLSPLQMRPLSLSFGSGTTPSNLYSTPTQLQKVSNQSRGHGLDLHVGSNVTNHSNLHSTPKQVKNRRIIQKHFATMIGAAARGVAPKKKFARKKRAAKVIGNAARGKRARKELEKKRAAAIKIAAAFRGKRTRRYLHANHKPTGYRNIKGTNIYVSTKGKYFKFVIRDGKNIRRYNPKAHYRVVRQGGRDVARLITNRTGIPVNIKPKVTPVKRAQGRAPPRQAPRRVRAARPIAQGRNTSYKNAKKRPIFESNKGAYYVVVNGKKVYGIKAKYRHNTLITNRQGVPTKIRRKA